MSEVLGDAELAAQLAKLPGWSRDGEALTKLFEAKDFDGAIRLVNDIAHIAKAIDHHPDLALSWNKVTVRTSSHDAGGITPRDIDLATRIQAIAG